MKHAKPEVKDDEALDEHNAPYGSGRFLEQVEFPWVSDEVCEAVLPEHQQRSFESLEGHSTNFLDGGEIPELVERTSIDNEHEKVAKPPGVLVCLHVIPGPRHRRR